MRRLTPILLVFGFASTIHGQQPAGEIPKSADPRIIIELIAQSPEIVHPIGVDFDAQGRLLVIESHTHFAPPGYKGPKFDRVRRLESPAQDGKPARFSTFFEGTRFTMDIAVHPDGSLYLATRNEILRLRDAKGTGQADVKERIAFLDTKGDYPHNGLSGLCFDSKGNLYFGMGENLGAYYKLTGSDGSAITGEGDGGHIFWCTAHGKKLRRVASGFWNPFGVCRDIYGRVFAVDNDPDAMPPCRLIHVVEGGDYGFQFRYGRQGRHPFQAWNGELYGTLPMVSGTGEAPCEVLSYESDNLPADYLGNLLATSWADHRVERYRLQEKGASFTATREPFIQGGKDFRPVGMAIAPDGSLYISDWVRRDYNLHGKGAIWRIRAKDAKPGERTLGLDCLHRPVREQAARKLAESVEGRKLLATELAKPPTPGKERHRSAALTALIDSGDWHEELVATIARRGVEEDGMRALALRALPTAPSKVGPWKRPVLRMEAMTFLKEPADAQKLLTFLADADPFLRHAAVRQLGKYPDLLKTADSLTLTHSLQRQGLLLAHRASQQPAAIKRLHGFLADADEEVRFLAAKWIADDKLMEFRPQVAAAIKNPKLNVRMYLAYATTLARLDGKQVNENELADYFFDRLADPATPPAMRVLALQLVPAKHGRLTLSFLKGLLKKDDHALRLEALRAISEHADPKRFSLFRDVILESAFNDEARAQAVLGLADRGQDYVDELLTLAEKAGPAVRDEAMRALIQTKPSDAQRARLLGLQGALADRLTGAPFFGKRPPVKDLDAWLKLLSGPADEAAGRRIFANGKLVGCNRCHRVEGRGNVAGPDLSTIGRTERASILESILQPSNNVAPHYQTWLIETSDGQIRTGLLTNTDLDDYAYLNEKGEKFRVNTRDIVSIRAVPNSIMPDGLADRLTDQELRDLLAYLCSRK